MQLRHYVKLQEELAINYCKLAVVSVDSPEINAAFRAGFAMCRRYLGVGNESAALIRYKTTDLSYFLRPRRGREEQGRYEEFHAPS